MTATPACGYYIGVPGHLTPFDGSHVTLRRSWQSNVTVHDGGLAPSYAQRTVRRRARSWDVAVDMSTPGEVAALHELISMPAATLVLVDPWAQVTNVLSPEASEAVSGDQGGGYALAEGGRVLRHRINAAAHSGAEARLNLGAAPIVPGGPVTVSTYAASRYGATVRGAFFGSSGSLIGSTPLSLAAPVDLARMHRISVTVPASAVPASAVAVQVWVSYAEYVARPAVTWTDHLAEWGIGGTALQCVLEDVVDNVAYAASSASGPRRLGVSATVREIGL